MHATMQSLPEPEPSAYADVPVAETVSAAAYAEQVL